MNAFTCFVMGLNKKEFPDCPREVRRAYHNTVFAWVLVTIMGGIAGWDIGHNLTNNTVYLGGAILGGAAFICIFDYFLISSQETGTFGKWAGGILRFIFSICVVPVAAIALVGLFFANDIDNKEQDLNQERIEVLDSNHETRITALFSDIKEQEKEVQEYHKNVCVPEANRVQAGVLYAEKHQHCINRRNEIEEQREPLEKRAQEITERYEENRSDLLTNKAGWSERYRILFNMIADDIVKLILTIAIFISFFVFDLRALINKLSISSNDEYHKRLKKINEENSAQNELNRKITKQEQIMVHAVQGFQSVLSNDNLIAHLKKFTEKNSSLRPLANEIIKSLEVSRKELESELKDYDVYDILSENGRDLNDGNMDADSSTEAKAPVNQYNIFYMTLPMKKVADRLWEDANRDGDYYKKLVFKWMNENISYNSNHSKEFYMTAREVFNSKMGVCGESAVLYGAFLKYKNQDWYYCHVEIDHRGKEINHACSLTTVNGSEVLVDIAYSSFGIHHQKWNMINEEQLLKNMISWNK